MTEVSICQSPDLPGHLLWSLTIDIAALQPLSPSEMASGIADTSLIFEFRDGQQAVWPPLLHESEIADVQEIQQASARTTVDVRTFVLVLPFSSHCCRLNPSQASCRSLGPQCSHVKFLQFPARDEVKASKSTNCRQACYLLGKHSRSCRLMLVTWRWEAYKRADHTSPALWIALWCVMAG